jgi:hypothetical protein
MIFPANKQTSLIFREDFILPPFPNELAPCSPFFQIPEPMENVPKGFAARKRGEGRSRNIVGARGTNPIFSEGKRALSRLSGNGGTGPMAGRVFAKV